MFKHFSVNPKKLSATLILTILLVSFVGLVSFAPSTKASVLFSDNFESTNVNTMSPWDGYYASGGAVNISTSYPYSGAKCFVSYLDAAQTTSWASIYTNVTGNTEVSILAQNCIFTYPPNATKSQYVLGFTQTTTGTGIAYAGIVNGSDNLIHWCLYYYDGAALTQINGTSTVDLEQSYLLRLSLTMGSGTGAVNLYIDGVNALNATGINNVGRTLNYARVGYSYSASNHAAYFYCDDVEVSGEYIEPPLPEGNDYLGISGYVTNWTTLASTVDWINTHDVNIYRVSFNPSYAPYTGFSHQYTSGYIQYLLDNTNVTVIVDANHIWVGQTSSTQEALYAIANWTSIRSRISTVLTDFGNNSRVMIETINEFASSSWAWRNQELVDLIRGVDTVNYSYSDGYNNSIVANPWSTASPYPSWSNSKLTDSLNETYLGMHFYFDYWSVSSAEAQMQYALNAGLKLINTEVGANSQEADEFTQTQVDNLQTFISWCTARGIGNCVWQQNDLANNLAYELFNFTFNIDTYTLSLTVTNPANTTYTNSSVTVSLSVTGNDTLSAYSWNVQRSNGSWVYGANLTSASTTLTLTIDDNYIFACKATGTNGTIDYKEVAFSVAIYIAPDTYTISLIVTSPINASYPGPFQVTQSYTGNDSAPTFNWNILLANGSWLYTSNQTTALGTVSLNGTQSLTFCGKITGANGAVDYQEVAFSIDTSIPAVYAVPVILVTLTGIGGAVYAFFYRRSTKTRVQVAFWRRFD